MTRRKGRGSIPLEPRWMPLIAERLAADAAGVAESAGRFSLHGLWRDYAWIARDMPDAQLWWISRDMTTLAVDTAEDREGFDGKTEVRIPSDRGLIVWQDGLPILIDQPEAVYDGRVRVDAMFWDWIDDEFHYQLYTADKELVARNRAWLEPGTPLVMAQAPRIRDGEQEHLLRILAATWALALQPAIASTGSGGWNEHDGPRPRALDKAIRRRNGGDVKIVHLRELQPRDERDAPGNGREYSCRWIVRGFYRQQPYGPGRELRRRQWIPPHVAGPSDKPLRIKPVVHVWRREG